MAYWVITISSIKTLLSVKYFVRKFAISGKGAKIIQKIILVKVYVHFVLLLVKTTVVIARVRCITFPHYYANDCKTTFIL